MHSILTRNSSYIWKMIVALKMDTTILKSMKKKTNIKDENQKKTNKNKQIPPATQIYYQQMGDYQ